MAPRKYVLRTATKEQLSERARKAANARWDYRDFGKPTSDELAGTHKWEMVLKGKRSGFHVCLCCGLFQDEEGAYSKCTRKTVKPRKGAIARYSIVKISKFRGPITLWDHLTNQPRILNPDS